MNRTERRLLWVFLFAVVVLSVVCLNRGCATLDGFGRDLSAAARGVAGSAAPPP